MSFRISVVAGFTAVAFVGINLSNGFASHHSGSGVVAAIQDGDTLTLTDGQKVRLLQIDSPELGTGECYSRAARTALLNLIPLRSRVTLKTDPVLDAVDRYGRILRYVKRGSMNANLEMVRKGAAAPYFYGGEEGRYANRLMAAARAAKAAKRGLWGASPRARLDPYRRVETGHCGPGSAAPPPTFAAPAPLPSGSCDQNYAGACVPPYPPDLDCADLRARGLALPVRVVGSDPHRLDGDGDGYGCE